MQQRAEMDDSSGVKQRILAAGRAEFARHGLSAGSVRAIGQSAGVTAAMINYYFGGKRALYDAVVAEAQARLLERLSAAVTAGDGTGLAPRLAAAYFDFLGEDQALQFLLLREVLDRGASVRSLPARHVRPLRVLFEQHFGHDDEAAHLAISLFGAVAGYFLYAPIVGAFLGADPHSRTSLARRRRHVVRLSTMFNQVSPKESR